MRFTACAENPPPIDTDRSLFYKKHGLDPENERKSWEGLLPGVLKPPDLRFKRSSRRLSPQVKEMVDFFTERKRRGLTSKRSDWELEYQRRFHVRYGITENSSFVRNLVAAFKMPVR